MNKIADSLQKSKLAEGKKLLVSNKVKADILGGILVEIGDKSIDLTVSSKIAKLNKLVTGKYIIQNNCELFMIEKERGERKFIHFSFLLT